jgi:hypothetical protein
LRAHKCRRGILAEVADLAIELLARKGHGRLPGSPKAAARCGFTAAFGNAR